MGSGILVIFPPIVRPGNHCAILHQNSTDGDFSLFSCQLGLRQGQSHKIEISQARSPLQRNFWCAREDSNHRHTV